LCGTALATDSDIRLELTEPRKFWCARPPAPAESLIEARIEPTKHELRFDNVFAAEKWEQGFLLAARLPLE
jgi:hypothetical protein